MKKNGLNWILAMAFLLSLFSCREEAKLVETHKAISIIEARKNDLDFTEFNKLTSKNALDIKADLKSISQKSTSKINFDDFRIDTTFIRKTISNSNQTTFSLRAFKKGENPRNHFYNIVYHLEENEWVAELVRFSFREDWLNRYQQNSKIPFWGKAEYLGSEKSGPTTSKSGCEMSVKSLCYCENHEPGECNGCSSGFRNVLIIDCSQSDGGNDGDTGFDWMNTPLPPGFSLPPYRDANSGGGGLTGTEFGNNPASIEDTLFKEEIWKYDLQIAIGSLFNDDPLTYMRFENYHVYTKGQNIAFIGSLVAQFINNKEFLSWASLFLWQNRDDVTPLQFQNWFLGKLEGKDGEAIAYDINYWENPNLNFPQQTLPSWQNYYDAFPHNYDGSGMTASQVYQLVGGEIYQKHISSNPKVSKYYQNACALRVSRALNYSGIIIPAVSGTMKGSDGKNYFLAAKALNAWMRKTFGTNPATSITPFNPNHSHYTASQGGINGQNFPSLLNGKKGIFSMVTESWWASGHADALQSNGMCINDCHYADAPVIYIDIWELN